MSYELATRPERFQLSRKRKNQKNIFRIFTWGFRFIKGWMNAVVKRTMFEGLTTKRAQTKTFKNVVFPLFELDLMETFLLPMATLLIVIWKSKSFKLLNQFQLTFT